MMRHYNKSYIILALAALAAAAGCQKDFSKHWDLTVDSSFYNVAYSDTVLNVTVWCSDSWQAEITEGSDWASLNKPSGRGVTTIKVLFDTNPGLARKATLRLTSSGLEQEVAITQRASVASPKLYFEDSVMVVPSGSYRLYRSLITNLSDELLTSVSVQTSYSGGEGWVSETKVEDGSEELPDSYNLPDCRRKRVSFRVASPSSGAGAARMVLSLEDATGEVWAAPLNIDKTADQPTISMTPDSFESGGDEKELWSVLSTNIPDEAASFVAEASYTDPSHGEFVDGLGWSGDTLHFSLSANASGYDREAALTVSYTDLDGTVTSTLLPVKQSRGHVSYDDFHIASADDLLSWLRGLPDWKSTDVITLDADIDMSGQTWTPADFTGTFDGGGHSIRGIVVEREGTAAFFSSLSGDAVVKNVTFGAEGDGSAFTVTSIASGQRGDVYAAPIGQTSDNSSVENVTNYAAVSFAAACGPLANNGNYFAGGIVGRHRSTGTVSSCHNYGTVSNLAAASQKGSGVANYVDVGGVCGAVQSSGSITSCDNHAAVLYQSSVYPSTANVGGVTGVINGTATVSGCNNSGTVTIDNSSAGSFNANIGGITGYVQTNAATLKNCRNLAGGDVTISGNKAGATAIGGIIGHNSNSSSEYTSCTNAAKVSVTYTSASGISLNAGGGAGYADGAAAPSFTDCSNSGEVSITYTATGHPNIGGFIGNVASTNAPSFSGCSNSGAVKIAHTSAGGGNVMAGGFAGRIAAASTELSSCSNSGEITFASSIKSSSWSHIGGLVGELYANGIKLSSCTSKGNITSTASISNLRLSGIVGVSENNTLSGMTVDGCTADGITISCAKAQHVGGIAGYVSSLSFSATNNTVKNVTLSTSGTVTNAAMLVGSENQASTLTGNRIIGGSVLGTALTADNFTSYLYKGTAPTLSDNSFASE